MKLNSTTLKYWYERGFLQKPRIYELMKQYSPTGYITGSIRPLQKEEMTTDLKLLSKFY
jgi:hypothetical protein